MQGTEVLSKGEYLRPQEFAPVTLKRYVFVSEGGKNYLLLEFRNNREEALCGLSFTLTQYDAEGAPLYSLKHSEDVHAGAGETFVCEKIAADPACADFSADRMSARFGGYVYSVRGGELAVDYVGAPSEPSPAPKPQGERIEGFTVAEKKPKYPAAIAVFACAALLCAAIVLIVQMFTFKSEAVTFMKDGVVYAFAEGKDVEDSDIYVCGYRGKGNAVIPAEIEGHTVTHVASGAFQWDSDITGIRFEGSIRIDAYAFANCQYLRTADFENVTSVEENAFYNCGLLEEVRSSTLTSIGPSAFMDCDSLKAVEISGENRDLFLGDQAFSLCSSLRRVNISPFTDYVGIPFDSCYGVEELSLNNYQYRADGTAGDPDSYSALSALFTYGNFGMVSSLKTLHIGYMDCIPAGFCMDFSSLESVTIDRLVSPVVGDYAFMRCFNLRDLDIPAVTEVGEAAFQSTDIETFDGSGLVYIGGYAFSDSALKEISLEENKTLTEIGDGAFMNCRTLGSPVLPGCLKNIGDRAFADCWMIGSVQIPSGIEYIGYGVFEGCEGLVSLTLPFLGQSKDNLTGLSGLFNGYVPYGLRTVVLTDATVIPSYAFSGYPVFEISLPDTLKNIEEHAFSDCSLRSLRVPDSVESIGYGAFSGCTSLEELDLPYLGLNASQSCTLGDLYGEDVEQFYPRLFPSLRSVRVRSGDEVPDRAFYRCERLETVVFDQSIRTIGREAFSGCYRLSSFTLPETLQSIGSSAFYQCYRLYEVKNETSFNIAAGSDEYGRVAEYALKVYGAGEEMPEHENSDGWIFSVIDGVRYLVGYPQTGSVSLPVTAESYRVAPYLFYGESIVQISSTGSAESIGEYAFADCSQLTEFTASEGLRAIGDSAFRSCYGLLRATLPSSLTEIGDYAFDLCERLFEIWNLSSLPLVAGETGYGGIARYALFVYRSADEQSRIVDDDGFIFAPAEDGWKLIDTNLYQRLVLPSLFSYNGSFVFSYTLGSGFGNASAEEIYIPRSVGEIEAGAFDGCSGLRAIYYAGTEEEWKEAGGYTPAGCEVFYESF